MILIALVSGSTALWDNSVVFPQPCLSGGVLEGTDHAFLRATNVVARNLATEITLGSQMWRSPLQPLVGPWDGVLLMSRIGLVKVR